jgi:primary-amine oxidase
MSTAATVRTLVTLALLLTLAGGAAAQQQGGRAAAEGHLVEWEGWSFRWRVLPRQGVALTNVSFGGRTVLKYAGVAEVFVPYDSGSPRPEDQRHHPFGENLIPLEPGVDCLPGGQCRAFGADGRLSGKRAVVMIHEEAPTAVYLGGEGRARAKTLVLWSAYALGDYTYVVRWRFGQDGAICPEVGLTGRLSHFGGDATNGAEVGAPKRALGHVHNLIYCLDFDVDGTRNTVEEFDYAPAGANRERAVTKWTPIKREAGRELSPKNFRSWRVVNRGSLNKIGQPRSYQIVPGGTGIYRGATRERFAHADLWVTRYRPDEVPGTRLVADALASHANDEDVENQDVVTWYMLSVHHQPRSEDWSAMPIDWVSFKILPRDFLDGSPVKPR